eukprot:jgi/Mesvir1/7471/Mv25818-RA.1
MVYSDLDPSLFVGVWKGELVFVFVHADDCDCFGPREWIAWFHSIVHARYPVGKLIFREPGKVVQFMGMDTVMDHDEHGKWAMLLQPKGSYVQDLVKEVMSSSGPLLASECGTLRGKLNWLACTTSPDLAVLSRLLDNVLCLIDRTVIVQYLLASPGLMLQGVDWDKPVELVSYCDSSLDARVLTKMRGRCAAVTTICNADQPTMSSIFAWYSRLHRRVYVGSDTAEARAYCEAASELSYFHALICWILAVGGTTPHLRRVIQYARTARRLLISLRTLMPAHGTWTSSGSRSSLIVSVPSMCRAKGTTPMPLLNCIAQLRHSTRFCVTR